MNTFDNNEISRRRFLTRSLHVAAGISLTTLPEWFVRDAYAREQETATGKPRKIGPNDTIQVGVIGPGGSKGGYRQGLGDAKRVAGQPGTKVIAVCDTELLHREEASKSFGDTALPMYNDFRELLARPDIDAVVIGTPDHWHAVISILAMQAGKDVYCEKPLALTIHEGRKMVEAARKYKRVFQTGSQQRSDGSKRFQLACELVRNGRLGRVKYIEARLPGAPSGGPFPSQAVPEGFDWEMWQGPCESVDYLKERTHGSFRYWYEYSGGMVTDWGAHHLDIIQWALGKDDSGPVKVEATGTAAPPDPAKRSYNVHTAFDITYTYRNGPTVLCTNKGENGIRFEGENGKWLFVNRDKIEASDPALLTEPLPKDATRLQITSSHEGNWVDCIRSREKPICDVEVGHRSATVCHMGNIALRLGGVSLEWNPATETFKSSPYEKAANAMRSRDLRAPWKI